MRTQSLLLYVPGAPLRVEALLPQSGLARMAGSLLAAGHETHILDYGSVEAMRRFAAPGLRTAVQQAGECWEPGAAGLLPGRLSSLLQARGMDTLFQEMTERRCREIAADVAAGMPLDFVVYWVHTREEIRETIQVARRVRERLPDVPQAIAGEYAALYGALVVSSEESIDCALTGDVETTVLAWAEHVGRREVWSAVPGLMYRHGSEVVHNPRERGAALESLPAAAYGREVYPAAHGGGKFKMLSVEQSRGGVLPGHALSEPLPHLRALRVKNVETLCEEMSMLEKQAGAYVFHVVGAGVPAVQVDALARALISRRTYVRYSRAGHIHRFDADSAKTLRQSGCRVIGFGVDTGSQRLLEDFYGHEFGVTETERALGACVKAGLFTTVGMSYPCAHDDYHTRAETIRLLSRTRPSSVLLEAPQLSPGSVWMQRAPEFGFRVDHGQYARWALGQDTRSWFDRGAPELPYRLAGWTRGRMNTAMAAMERDVIELGLLLRVSACEAMIAQCAGYAGEEAVFAAMLRRRLFTSDAKGLAELVSEFNDNTAAPTNTVAFRPFVPVRAAVGN